MSDPTLSNRDIVDLIKGQARMETKLDTFLSTQSKIEKTVSDIDVRVTRIEGRRARERGYIAGIMAVISSAMIFFIPWAKAKLGL